MNPENKIIRLSDENFRETVLENPIPVLVEIEADWSCACLMMSPAVERIAREFDKSIVVGRMEIDAGKEVMKEFAISTFFELPIFLFFKGGRLVDRIIGSVPRKELEQWIAGFLNQKVVQKES